MTADGYVEYYTEKLWQLLPEVHRTEDGLTSNPDALRGIIEVLASDVAKVRRSIDRLWEDQHIETCDDWAVPYLGDLVGARLVSARDRRGRRVDVANAIHFRRRRGTPDLLDTLVRAMSGWDVVLVEGFRKLARTRHRLDAAPVATGLMTSTPPGGTADLRRPSGTELTDGPFGEFFHLPDIRRLRGRDGRHGIRKLNFHLFRLRAYPMTGVDPVQLEDPDGLGLLRTFTIDPSGRDIPLFIDGEPPELDGLASSFAARTRSCGAPPEWTVTQAIRCRLLGHTRFEITTNVATQIAASTSPPLAADQTAIVRALGLRFARESLMRGRLQDLGATIPSPVPDWYRELVARSLVEACGKAQLYPAQIEVSVSGDAVPTQEIHAADLWDRTCQPLPTGELARLLVDPHLGRFATVPVDEPADAEPSVLRYVYGFSADIGAGPYSRPEPVLTARVAVGGMVPDGGVLQGDGLTFADNRSYDLFIRSTEPIGDARLQAEVQRRPYVRLRGDEDNPSGANLLPLGEGQTFVIDGGWYGPAGPDESSPAVVDFVIEGLPPAADTDVVDFERVEIRYATLDPGGLRGDGIRIPALRLRVRGQVRKLVVRRSITGPIAVIRDAGAELANVEEIVICDSIIDGRAAPDEPAIDSDFATVRIESSTIIGDIRAHELHASNTIVVGVVRVINNQAGCFRFSASVPGDDGRLPPRFRDVLAAIPPAYFGSLRFGDPRYTQLSSVAPPEIAKGAEDGSQMGAFAHLLEPIRLQSVQAKLDEYGPLGMLAQFLFEDELPSRTSSVHAGPIAPEPPNVPAPPPPDPGNSIPAPLEPAPQLPTSCDDEAPPPPAVKGPVKLLLDEADLGGAPDFWRGRDWRKDSLPGRATTLFGGIPFDRVEGVVELDGRVGAPPAQQGWQASNPQSATWVVDEENGAIEFAAGDLERSASLIAERDTAWATSSQVHGYVVLAIDELPIDELPAEVVDVRGEPPAGQKLRSARVPLDPFDITVVTGGTEGPTRGIRMGWARDRHVGGVRLVSLDSGARRPVLGREPSASPLVGWQSISMQAHPLSDEVVVSVDDRIQELPLEWFGQMPPRARSSSSFGVRIGMAGRGKVRGALRTVVVSTPGRFVRAWLATEVPQEPAALRLRFAAESGVEGRASILVGYASREPGEAATRRPKAQRRGILTLVDGRGEVVLPLPDVKAGPLLLTIEREAGAQVDSIEQTIRLVDGEWQT
ncbi:hypothetical protein [Paraliomyxa miuraensis]|uniref:hypothetical protein n=1 Tax=Paraliomyxa miuraensis TaxID=376150 RepID=UPI002256DA90|nr:hypothetical protein [Paraliomyxa miuraensis]MCX4245558.1 hypothetical protein [Paraliomyxa miuraensis]